MRIALDIRFISDHYPGIGRYAYALARLLPALAPEDAFLLLYGSAENTRYDLAPIFQSPNVEAVEVRSSPRGLAQECEVGGLVRRLGIELYHSPCHFMPYTLPCKAVATIHDLTPRVRPESLTLAKRVLYSAVVRVTARRANRLLADSESTLGDLANWLPWTSAKAERVYLGVDPEFTPVSESQVEALRRRAKLPAHYVLHVGTNKPHKNLSGLLQAWSALDMRIRSGYTLVLAGPRDEGDDEEERLCQTVGITDSVTHYGPVAEADLRALYQGADLFVFPSLYEGFGLPVLEAMAMGTPVSCSDRSSLPEVAGDAALLFDPVDTGAIAHAIQTLLSDDRLRHRLGARGKSRARAFTWERTARETLQAYRHVLASV